MTDEWDNLPTIPVKVWEAEPGQDYLDCLVSLGVFTSRGQARKAGHSTFPESGEIFKIGRHRYVIIHKEEV